MLESLFDRNPNPLKTTKKKKNLILHHPTNHSEQTHSSFKNIKILFMPNIQIKYTKPISKLLRPITHSKVSNSIKLSTLTSDHVRTWPQTSMSPTFQYFQKSSFLMLDTQKKKKKKLYSLKRRNKKCIYSPIKKKKKKKL